MPKHDPPGDDAALLELERELTGSSTARSVPPRKIGKRLTMRSLIDGTG